MAKKTKKATTIRCEKTAGGKTKCCSFPKSQRVPKPGDRCWYPKK